MSKTEKERTYAELVSEVVRESRNPISFDEIVRRVELLREVDSRTSRTAVCNALAEFWLIVEIGEEKYGWYPHLINGSRVRVPLVKHDGELELIVFDDEARELLWPELFAGQDTLGDREPVGLRLPSGAHTAFPLEYLGRRTWGTTASQAFWRWLKRCKAASGDALIIEAVDVEARCYSVTHESQWKRDAAAVRKRTAEIENAALDYVRNNRNQDPAPDLWSLTRHLLAAGYKHSVPPEPISCIWNRVAPEPEQPPAGDEGMIGRRRASGKKPRSVYQLKILLSESEPPIWRRVLVTDTTTLNDLHWTIQRSMGWSDSHLHQFIIDGEYYSDPEFELDEYASDIHDEYKATLREVAANKPDRFFSALNNAFSHFLHPLWSSGSFNVKTRTGHFEESFRSLRTAP
jgi:Plasmid pRiA4b ORF-3-like protein